MPKTITSSRDNIPSYVDVYNQLYADLTEGVYPPESRLPSEQQLAKQYGVTRHILRQALVILVEDGLVCKYQGSGNFVAARLPKTSGGKPGLVNPITAFANCEIQRISIKHNYGPPTKIAQARLGIGPAAQVLAANNYFYGPRGMMARSFVQIPTTCIQALGPTVHTQEDIYALINTGIYQKAKHADYLIRTITAEGELPAAMEIPPGFPLLYIEQVLRDRENQGLARVKNYLIPACFDIQFTL